MHNFIKAAVYVAMGKTHGYCQSLVKLKCESNVHYRASIISKPAGEDNSASLRA